MTRSFRYCSAAVAALLSLSACGGGGSGSAVPQGPSSSKPGAYASAALSFFIPRASALETAAKRPAYLPSTTQSIVVNVFNADGTPTSPPVAPSVTNVGSSSCTAASGGQQCTVTVTVPSGSLLFAIAAYAQANGAGALLSSSTTSATIGSGPNNVAVTLNSQTQYVGTNLDGGGMQSVTIDHQAGTFAVTQNGHGNTSGTYTTLPNGDLKATVTAATDGTTIGSIAYIREIANGALMFVATDTSTPSVDGTSSSGDFGMMTAVQPCPTASSSFGINVVGIAGPNFPSVVATHEAYDVGTGSVTNGTLTFTGTSYTLSGTNLGAASASPETCTNGIFSDASGGSVAFDPAGFLVVSSGVNQGQSPSITGNFGLRAPSLPLDLSAIASQTYEAYEGGFVTSQGTTAKYETPSVVKPGGGNMLSGCPYANFETNSAGTNCTTITLTAQPFPGLITGTATDAQLTTPFVAVAGLVNGKYVLLVLSESQSTGEAVNLALMQQ